LFGLKSDIYVSKSKFTIKLQAINEKHSKINVKGS